MFRSEYHIFHSSIIFSFCFSSINDGLVRIGLKKRTLDKNYHCAAKLESKKGESLRISARKDCYRKSVGDSADTDIVALENDMNAQYFGGIGSILQKVMLIACFYPGIGCIIISRLQASSGFCALNITVRICYIGFHVSLRHLVQDTTSILNWVSQVAYLNGISLWVLLLFSIANMVVQDPVAPDVLERRNSKTAIRTFNPPEGKAVAIILLATYGNLLFQLWHIAWSANMASSKRLGSA